MIIGRIIGKCTTARFEFLAEQQARKFEYCQVYHRDYEYVLCQVIELEKTADRVSARCIVIGYKDKRGRVMQIRSPFDIGTEVLKADEGFIRSIVLAEDVEKGALVGRLEGTGINIMLDLNKLLTKHIAVLAKSGSGKSYTVGVLLEEIMERNVPLLIIDPHGEYSSLKKENDNKEDLSRLAAYELKPKSFSKKIHEYGDMSLDPGMRPIFLNENMTAQELLDILPTKLTNNQLGLLYSTIKDMDSFSFSSLILRLQACDNNSKWNVINIIEYISNLNIFSSEPTSLNEIVQPGRCSIINMKGIEPDVQEIIVYKLLKDLFSERKKGMIPPFFLVIEEAHNFVPEKGYSEAKCSKVIKTIASEGRKFGLGLCVVSQRPAIVQKTVLSQCTTQMILKITNPNDLKAVGNSIEGMTYEAENEIRNLSVGTALITGVSDMPLFVSVRPRKTKHGGEAVDILGCEQESKFFDDLKDFKEKDMLPVIRPNLSKDDIRLMSEEDVKISTVLIPCMMFLCRNRSAEFNLLVEMLNGSVVIDIDDVRIKSAFLPELDKLSREELKMLETGFKLKEFSTTDLIKKAGLPIDSAHIVEELVKKGYFAHSEKQGEYVLSERYVLSNLSRHAFYKKIEFSQVDFEKKLEKKQRVDTVKAKLSKFTDVIDQRECFLMHYSVG
ncbi:ATP-binding protein [Candidatus Woesearchaeota archaeon]|nr:ATP-binding protein [Candidatus Woesearchaeota archaeon]